MDTTTGGTTRLAASYGARYVNRAECKRSTTCSQQDSTRMWDDTNVGILLQQLLQKIMGFKSETQTQQSSQV